MTNANDATSEDLVALHRGRLVPPAPLLDRVRCIAREIERINAQGGSGGGGEDETARLLYNAADPCHDWDRMVCGPEIQIIFGLRRDRAALIEEWRRVARVVDGWIDEMFPSIEACDAAREVLVDLMVEQRRGPDGEVYVRQEV